MYTLQESAIDKKKRIHCGKLKFSAKFSKQKVI
jgi:hypothetical protein